MKRSNKGNNKIQRFHQKEEVNSLQLKDIYINAYKNYQTGSSNNDIVE